MRAFALTAAAFLALAVSSAEARGLSVPLNHSVRLPLSGPAQSVVVGSPSVVDVAVVDSRTVYVSGRTPGDTDVTVVDPLGRVVFRGDVRVAGGAAVSVFRGSARTDAMCAPYCRALPDDEPTTSSGSSQNAGAATATNTPMPGSTTGQVVTPQTIASVPQALPLSH